MFGNNKKKKNLTNCVKNFKRRRVGRDDDEANKDPTTFLIFDPNGTNNKEIIEINEV